MARTSIAPVANAKLIAYLTSKRGMHSVQDRQIVRLSFVTGQKRPFLTRRSSNVFGPCKGAAVAVGTRELPFSSVTSHTGFDC